MMDPKQGAEIDLDELCACAHRREYHSGGYGDCQSCDCRGFDDGPIVASPSEAVEPAVPPLGDEVLSEPYFECVCGVRAYPLTDDTTCNCSDIYEQEWTRHPEAVESDGCDINCKSVADCDGSCASDEEIAKFSTPPVVEKIPRLDGYGNSQPSYCAVCSLMGYPQDQCRHFPLGQPSTPQPPDGAKNAIDDLVKFFEARRDFSPGQPESGTRLHELWTLWNETCSRERRDDFEMARRAADRAVLERVLRPAQPDAEAPSWDGLEGMIRLAEQKVDQYLRGQNQVERLGTALHMLRQALLKIEADKKGATL